MVQIGLGGEEAEKKRTEIWCGLGECSAFEALVVSLFSVCGAVIGLVFFLTTMSSHPRGTYRHQQPLEVTKLKGKAKKRGAHYQPPLDRSKPPATFHTAHPFTGPATEEFTQPSNGLYRVLADTVMEIALLLLVLFTLGTVYLFLRKRDTSASKIHGFFKHFDRFTSIST